MRFAAVIAAAAFVVPVAHAGVLLGVHGDSARFAAQTGQQSQIHHTFMTYGNGSSLRKIVSTMGPVPLLALNTTSDTPRAIGQGQTDQFLFQLNSTIAAWAGNRFYVRPFPEMNAYWVASSAYNHNGTRRDSAHSTLWNRKALARIAVVLRGGARDAMNAQLARLGLPGVRADLPAMWAAAEKLYKAHPSKPFAFPEWGLWGFDDVQYVRDMAKWVRQHRRMEFIAYFSGRSGSIWDLASKPLARAAYRTLITPLGTLP